MLLLFVPRVIAVLADKKYAIDGQFLSPQRQRLDNAWIDGNTVLDCQSSANVSCGAFWELVNVHRGHVDPWCQEAVVGGETLQILGHDDIGV